MELRAAAVAVNKRARSNFVYFTEKQKQFSINTTDELLNMRRMELLPLAPHSATPATFTISS